VINTRKRRFAKGESANQEFVLNTQFNWVFLMFFSSFPSSLLSRKNPTLVHCTHQLSQSSLAARGLHVKLKTIFNPSFVTFFWFEVTIPRPVTHFCE
jgi:hypothetical protein